MFFASREGRQHQTTAPTKLAIESLEGRRVLTAASFAGGVVDIEPSELSSQQADGFTSYDFGLDTVVARDADTSNLLLPAVQKATAETVDGNRGPRAEGFTSYDFGLDTVVATDQIFADIA